MNEMRDPVRYAVKRRRRGPGWIWAIPVAVFAIVIWLFARELIARGPLVTVVFDKAPGVNDNTRVEYNGLDVGQVEDVALQPDLQHVKLSIRMRGSMDGHLGPGTRFWISGGDVSLTNLGSLRALVAGPQIGIDPHPGPTQDQFTGLDHEPVYTTLPKGEDYVLHAAQLGGVGRGTAIYYRDLKVGEVRDYTLTGHGFDLSAFILAPYDRLVHADTRFWNAGAVQVSTDAAGPRVSVQSIPSLFQGAVAFETPDNDPGPPAKPGSGFTLWPDRDTATYAPGPDAVLYRVDFATPPAGLQKGAAVQLEGTRVGSVRDATMEYDPATGKLGASVVLALEPRHIHLAGDTRWAADPRPQMDAMLRRLIADGLRAELASAVPVVGGKLVSLRIVPHAAPATLEPGSPPVIPAAPSAGVDNLIADAGQVMANVNDIVAKLDGMPLTQIAAEVHDATQHLSSLAASPELTQSLKSLDGALSNLDQATAQARGKVGPLLTEFQRVAQEAEKAAASAHTLLASTGGAGGAETSGLAHTLYEVTRAAQSLRDLSDYLTRHPGSLLSGR